VGAAREVDFVCRIGGDEFALLLPHTTNEGGQALIDRISHTLRTEPLRLADGQELSLKAGFGIATTTSDSANTAELIEQADAAMYQSKRSGQLCTV
jgi:diguanylate cyclase (GGDEF)-like protein